MLAHVLLAGAAASTPPVLGAPPDPAADPRGALLHALLRDMSQDGVSAEPEVLAQEYRTLCAAGVSAACDPGAWRDTEGRFDLVAAGTAFEPRCTAGDPVACLVAGWSLSQERPGTYAWAARDPDGAEARFRQACDAGLVRACTELAHLQSRGLGTYPSPRRAREAAIGLCDDRAEPEACRLASVDEDDGARLVRAVELGHAAPLADLAARAEAAEAPEAWGVACLAGVAAACDDAALGDPANAARWYTKGCALGDGSSCARDQLARAQQDPSFLPTAVATLSGLCATSVEACREARFLEQGAPALATRQGRFPRGQKDLDSVMVDLQPAIWACYVAALGRDPAAAGTPRLHLLVGEDGGVRGSFVEEPLDPPFATCLEGVGLAARFRAPVDGPALAAVPIPLAHQAVTRATANGADAGAEIAAVNTSSAAWGREVDACWVEHQRPVQPGSLRVGFTATRAGEVEGLTSLEPEDPELVGCVARAIAGIGLDHPPALPTKVDATVSFLMPAEPPGDDVVRRPAPLPTPASRSTWKVLVLVVPASEMDGRKGVLGKGSVASIRAAHDEMAVFVEQATHAAVHIEHTYRMVEAVTSGGLLDDDDGNRFRLDPSDLPSELVRSIEPLTWDVVFLWTPLPSGFPRPALGTAWTSEPLRGAILVTGGIQHREDLRANAPSPAFELPLHEWYHTVQSRGGHELGASLPDNHRAARLWDGRVLSPRTWRRGGSTTAVTWYDLMLGSVVHPDLWADLEQAPREVVPDQQHDLALRAGPLAGAPVERGHLVVDGLLAAGTYDLAAVARAGEASPWFGMQWSAPVEVSRVVAWPGTDEGHPTVTAARVEGRTGGPWTALATLAPAPDGRWSGEFTPREVTELRVVVTAADGRRPRMLEVGVYGPDASPPR